ncbi:MOSC domain-containing protein [Stachybotrys elegans]|uniref:MOSC domain-containing protein n=1 Tax=Stachybotrys elegans TaxID=80388 RepID=A0A8K0WW51_9HYPO|nr:MOSC domain-containing protein [Stachybotrys elegans]
MKVTALYVYPVKSLRGIRLDQSQLGPQGLRYDRRFIIYRVEDDGTLRKVQVDGHPQCSRFYQEIVGGSIQVRYQPPDEPLLPPRPEHQDCLEIPLDPNLSDLEQCDVNLHQSLVKAYRMGPRYEAWLSACFGFETRLFYIGDSRRPVLGSFAPVAQPAPPSGWLSTISSFIGGNAGAEGTGPEPYWLNFSDCAPYLITTEASLHNVNARFAESDVGMYKFRPNIVVDGEREWDEDFWGSLSLKGQPAFAMTKMCTRCVSLNVDYDTGRVGEGERGTVLKKLASDRRVDPGSKYSPVFGRYAFLDSSAAENAVISVGDEVIVTSRIEERPMNDWPIRDPEQARFYRYA